MKQLQGADAEQIRGAVQDTFVTMPPQFLMRRAEKMKLNASDMSLPIVSHMREAQLGGQNSDGRKGSLMIPC